MAHAIKVSASSEVGTRGNRRRVATSVSRRSGRRGQLGATSPAPAASSSPGCTKTSESLYGFDRNGCTKWPGIRTNHSPSHIPCSTSSTEVPVEFVVAYRRRSQLRLEYRDRSATERRVRGADGCSPVHRSVARRGGRCGQRRLPCRLSRQLRSALRRRTPTM